MQPMLKFWVKVWVIIAKVRLTSRENQKSWTKSLLLGKWYEMGKKICLPNLGKMILKRPMPSTYGASAFTPLSFWLSPSSCPLSSLFPLSLMSSLNPFSLPLSPHLPLPQSLLMATCLSIIDILTGLASRPRRPTFIQPGLLHQSPHETLTHTYIDAQVCVRQKLCLCVFARVCVEVGETERERLSERPHTASSYI